MRLVFEFRWDDLEGVLRPARCPYPGCQSIQIRLKQVVRKPVRDAVCEEVVAHRYQCLSCGRTFRAYPAGVSRAHTSQRVQKIALLFYLMGLGYGAVARVLDALGIYLCKSQVCGVVHHVLGSVREARREILFRRARVSGPKSGVASVQYGERWLSVRLCVHNPNRWAVELEGLSPNDALSLREKVQHLASIVGAQVRTAEEIPPARATGHIVESVMGVPFSGGGDL